LYGEQNKKRKALRDRQISELKAVRAKPSTPGNHAPQIQPEQHQGHAFITWKNLNAARQEAMKGVFRSTAQLRDNADSEHLDLTKSQAGNRYMQPGARMAGDASDRAERAHLDISRREQRELDALASKFASELDADRRKFEQQARERADLQARHASENAAHR
jgi:hypothetical protein